MADVLAVPGDRSVRATLDGDGGDGCVVACPPHPQYGGSRRDARLRAVSGALVDAGLDCLRLDYGPWDGGVGERDDVHDALDWAAERYERVGLFGYSFGAGVALLVAADRDDRCAVSVLAPPATSVDDGDAATAIESITVPLQAIAGEQDTTVGWETVLGAVDDRGGTTHIVPDDHFFGGHTERVAGLAGDFLADHCP
jgi:alpha/beta superfamily hydrolase